MELQDKGFRWRDRGDGRVVTEGMRKRIAQAAVCGLVLFCTTAEAANADPAAQEISAVADDIAVSNVFTAVDDIAASNVLTAVDNITALNASTTRDDITALDVSTVSGSPIVHEGAWYKNGLEVQAVAGVPEGESAWEATSRIVGPLRMIHQICDATKECNNMNVLAPWRWRLSVDRFLDRMEAYAELYWEGNRSAIDAVYDILDIDGHVCFGQYDKTEIRVVEDVLYDSEGGIYFQYGFYLPNQSEPAALAAESVRYDGLFYVECGPRFWTNDPKAAAMPEVHSFLKENKRWLQKYLETANLDGTYEVVYKGVEKKKELNLYQALHYSITEKSADEGESTWEVYVDKSYLDFDFFYLQTAKESYEKRILRTWESSDGHSYVFSCSKAFQIGGDDGWKIEKDWEINVLKDGKFLEYLNISAGGAPPEYGELRVNDYNFDNIPDIAVIWGTPANWGGNSTDLYIRNEEGGCHYAGTFIDNPYRNTDTRTIYTFARGGAYSFFYEAYQYRDGVFVGVGSLEEVYTEEGSVIYTVRDEAGNEEVYRDELPDKWKVYFGQRSGLQFLL